MGLHARPARKVGPRTGTASDWPRPRAVLQATAARRVCARCLQRRAGVEKKWIGRKSTITMSARWLERRSSPPLTTSSDNFLPRWRPSTSTRRSIGMEPLSTLPSSVGSSCNTRRSITVSGASMPRSRGSTRRSAGARHGACEAARPSQYTANIPAGEYVRHMSAPEVLQNGPAAHRGRRARKFADLGKSASPPTAAIARPAHGDARPTHARGVFANQ